MVKYKLAVLTSHSIPYQTPLFKRLAEYVQIDLMVYFCWDFGIRETYYDPGFGKKIKWDIPLFDGYQYKFLRNFSLKPSSDFWGQINPEIFTEIKRNKPDALLVFGWNSFTNWLAFITAFLNKIPVFMRGDNPLNQELLKSSWKRKIKKNILGWLFKRISAFLYCGEENKKFYQYYGVPEDRLFFCPHAVDNERFISSGVKTFIARRKALRKELGISDKDIVILFGGRLIKQKRPMDLLRAYEKLLFSNLKSKSLNLVFFGDGPLRPELEKYVKEYNIKNVCFVGFKNQTDLPGYYALADVFVLPSGVGETWGLVVNEAMCFRLPIVVSNLVGCGVNLIEHNKNGYIFPLGDINKLASYLEDLIKDERKRKEFGEKSFKIIQNYSYEKDIDSILKAFIYIKSDKFFKNY